MTEEYKKISFAWKEFNRISKATVIASIIATLIGLYFGQLLFNKDVEFLGILFFGFSILGGLFGLTIALLLHIYRHDDLRYNNVQERIDDRNLEKFGVGKTKEELEELKKEFKGEINSLNNKLEIQTERLTELEKPKDENPNT